MTKAELIQLLRRILRNVELARDLREKLEEIIASLERNEPTAITIARLLADLIELATEPLPGPIADFIKAYAEAFKTAIDNIIGILWDRYRRLRENGLTHQEANDSVSADAAICEWLRFRWDYTHMPIAPPPPVPAQPKPSTPPPPDWPGGPGKPAGAPELLWAPEDNNCCSALVPPQKPKVSASGSYFKEGSSWYITADVKVTHPCGLKYGPDTDVYIGVSPNQDIKLERLGRPTGDSPIANGRELNWDKVQVASVAPRRVRIHIRAVSRCMNVYDGFVELSKTP